MKNIKRQVFLFMMLSMTNFGNAQSVQRDLDTYMQSVRTGSFKAVPDNLLNTIEAEELLSELPRYQADSVPKIRSKAYYIAKTIGQKQTKAKTVKTAIGQLVSGVKDADSGISGNNIEALTSFSKGNFTKQHINQIAGYINPNFPHIDILLKLAGYLEIADAKDKMLQITESGTSFQTKWSARLALARMEDQNSIDYLLGKLEKAPIDDNFMYDFAPDLVYTRQEAIFEFLEDIVQSNEKNCYSPDPDSDKRILCGYRAMEYLTIAIDNYPLPIDEFGELEVTDYKQSLETLREWFDNNETYSISKEVY